MNNELREHIREAACGEEPTSVAGPPNISAWIGFENQWEALDFMEPGEGRFYTAPPLQQRLFLLLVAEAA